MIRKIISNLFNKNKQEEPENDIVPLKFSLAKLNHFYTYGTGTQVLYNKKEKILTIKDCSGREQNFEFPFKIAYTNWHFPKDQNRENENTYEIDVKDHPFILDIIKIEMKNIGINGSISFKDKNGDDSCHLIKLDSNEDYAIFSLYFSDYINHTIQNSILISSPGVYCSNGGYIVVTGGGGGGGVSSSINSVAGGGGGSGYCMVSSIGSAGNCSASGGAVSP